MLGGLNVEMPEFLATQMSIADGTVQPTSGRYEGSGGFVASRTQVSIVDCGRCEDRLARLASGDLVIVCACSTGVARPR